MRRSSSRGPDGASILDRSWIFSTSCRIGRRCGCSTPSSIWCPGSARRGRRELRPDDFFFDGHFPGEPIVPAVILVEMIAQVGGLAAGAPASPGVESARRRRCGCGWPALGPFKFPRAARPGARLEVAGARGRPARRAVQDRRGGHRRRPAGRGRQRDARSRPTLRPASERMRACCWRLTTAGQMRRLMRDLRTEASGPGREAVAVGLGVFIGCLPFYGFHLLMCLAAGWLLRLNRLKLYVAANISNPLMAPLLILVGAAGRCAGAARRAALADARGGQATSIRGASAPTCWSAACSSAACSAWRSAARPGC